jgi:hypothetical protein
MERQCPLFSQTREERNGCVPEIHISSFVYRDAKRLLTASHTQPIVVIRYQKEVLIGSILCQMQSQKGDERGQRCLDEEQKTSEDRNMPNMRH